MKFNRYRAYRFGLILIVVFFGLFSRKISAYLPEIINTYLPDALWAVMIYLIVGFVFLKWSVLKTGIVSLLFCYFIELSQLYHAEWINVIRHTTLGGLVLGYGFLWSDILAYSLGVGSAVGVGMVSRLRKR